MLKVKWPSWKTPPAKLSRLRCADEAGAGWFRTGLHAKPRCGQLWTAEGGVKLPGQVGIISYLKESYKKWLKNDRKMIISKKNDFSCRRKERQDLLKKEEKKKVDKEEQERQRKVGISSYQMHICSPFFLPHLSFFLLFSAWGLLPAANVRLQLAVHSGQEAMVVRQLYEQQVFSPN